MKTKLILGSLLAAVSCLGQTTLPGPARTFDPATTTDNKASEAYSWGDHAEAGYLDSVDPSTMRKSGSRAYLQDWIPDNLFDLWYQVNLNVLASDQNFIDGPGYIFDDENGIITNRCLSQQYKTPGYGIPTSIYGYWGLRSTDDDATRSLLTTSTNTATTGNRTVSVWAYWPTSLGYAYILRINGYDFWFYFRTDGFGPVVVEADGAGAYPMQNVTISPGTWVLATMTYGSGTIRVYVNGVEKVNTGATLNTDTSFPAYVLNPYGSNPDVRMRNWCYWNRALASNEVFGIYQAGSTSQINTNAAPYDTVTLAYPLQSGGTNETNLGPDSLVKMQARSQTNAVVSVNPIVGDMVLVSTNTQLSFIASNAIPTVIANTSGLTTNLLRVGIYDLQNNVTNWGGALTQLSSASATQYLYKAAAITMTGTTNVSVIVSLSSNSTAIIKGVAAPCGQ